MPKLALKLSGVDAMELCRTVEVYNLFYSLLYELQAYKGYNINSKMNKNMFKISAKVPTRAQCGLLVWLDSRDLLASLCTLLKENFE